MVDLNELIPQTGIVDYLQKPGGINYGGQVICRGANSDYWQAYVLTPITQ